MLFTDIKVFAYNKENRDNKYGNETKEGSDMSEAQIGYILGNEELLARIGPLWEELNEHHKQRSPILSRNMSF